MTHPRRLSIAMCTYNGARYLEQQLRSIAVQTLPADEFVVCDDGSDDGSVDIIRRFAGEVACPVRLRNNEQRLGRTKNFEQALGLCEGEIIVLADQDDLWHPTKLARLEAVFVSCPRVGAVISDAEIVDENLHPMGYRLWDSLNFSPFERRQAARGMFMEVLLKRNVATGATLAFTTELRELVLPIPPEWVHDAWIALLIAAVADVALIDEPLIQYRQHPTQQIGAARDLRLRRVARAVGDMLVDFQAYSDRGKQNCAAALTRFALAYERLVAKGKLEQDSWALSELRAKIAHFRVRTELPQGRWARVPVIARELLNRRYHRYSRGLLSVANDLTRQNANT